MARYIDADFLIEQLQPAKNSLWNKNDHSKSMSEMIEDFCTELKNAPAADVAPKSEVAREIFEEIEKIIDKHHSECYEYEDGDECDTAITYLSYASVDIAELKKKYTEGEKNEDQSD